MRAIIALALVMAAATLAPACNNRSSLPSKHDAAPGLGGTDGRFAATGGTSGPTFETAGGSLGTGGGPRTGGVTEGSRATGGSTATGGTSAPDDAAAADGPATCSCAPGKLTWDCYCSVFDCTRTLASYQPDGGAPTAVRAIQEYADCNLVVVTYKEGYGPEVHKVFDLTTGALVGDEVASDTPTKCPFGDAGNVAGLGAGRFPDASCKVSKCTVGPLGGPYCGSGGSGGARQDGGPASGGSSGAGGGGGSGGGAGNRDASASGCSCNGGSTTLDCFCSAGGIAYGCERALSTFTSPGGSPYATIEEFADCGLVAVTTTSSFGMQLSVYDRSTGQLVGRKYYSDIVERCPFDGTDTGSRTISAGRLPDSSCKQTSCREGTQTITFPCPRS